MTELNQTYRKNRRFFLQRNNFCFLGFLFLSACTFKLNHIDSLGMGYEAVLYFITAWVLFSRFPVTQISYFYYGFIIPFAFSLSLIALRIMFSH